MATCNSIYRIAYHLFGNSNSIAARAMFLPHNVVAVILYISFRIFTPLYVAVCCAYTGVGGTQVCDNNHSFVALRLWSVVVEGEVPAAVAVDDLVTVGGYLGCQHGRYSQQCKGENLTFHTKRLLNSEYLFYLYKHKILWFGSAVWIIQYSLFQVALFPVYLSLL